MGSPPVYFLEFAIFLPAAASRKMVGLWENSGRDLVIRPRWEKRPNCNTAIICGELGRNIGDVSAYRRYRCEIDRNQFWNKTFRSQHKRRLRLNNLKKMIAALNAARGRP
jgi:hypothetical protein